MNAAVYVDGYNLYYAVFHKNPTYINYRWLDLHQFFEHIVEPKDQLIVVKYFTAEATPFSANQAAYLGALGTVAGLQIIRGKYKTKSALCKVIACLHTGSRNFKTLEEKGTDVNIAIHMIDDAYRQVAEKFVLVSGDSDLVPALRMLKLRHPAASTAVYVPAGGNAKRGSAPELRMAADEHHTLPLWALERSQLPNSVSVGGASITRPATW